MCSAGQPVFRFLRRILSSDSVPADFKYFDKHAEAVAQRAKARSFHMGPGNWHFLYFQSCAARQIQQLGIKSPPLDSLQRKNHPGRVARERLESTLCVFEIQAEQYSQSKIE